MEEVIDSYCVPYVLHRITGKPVSDINEDIIRARVGFNRKSVTTVSLNEIVPFLGAYGKHLKRVPLREMFSSPPTAQKLVENLPLEYKAFPVIILSSTHAMMTQYGFIDDNHSKRLMKPSEHPGKRRRIIAAFAVF